LSLLFERFPFRVERLLEAERPLLLDPCSSSTSILLPFEDFDWSDSEPEDYLSVELDDLLSLSSSGLRARFLAVETAALLLFTKISFMLFTCGFFMNYSF